MTQARLISWRLGVFFFRLLAYTLSFCFFERIEKEGLKVNANNSCFAQLKLEYLGFWITREVIMPTPQKVKEIKNIDTPTTKKQSKSFVGIINYYRDMWLRKSDILSPLSDLMSK